MTKSVTITAPEGVPFIEFEREFDAPVAADGVEQRVETAKPLFVDQPVLVDPGRECLELGRIQVHGSALGVPRPGDQPCLLEYRNVLRNRLLGDLEGIGQLVDRCRASAEAGNDPAANRIGQGGEGPVEPVVCGGIDDHVVNLPLYQPVD